MRLESAGEDSHRNPIVCRQCSNAYCVRACPIPNVFSQDPVSRVMVINSQRCTGCGLCARYCPYGVIVRTQSSGSGLSVYVKCDLCYGDPQCVRYCPTGALKYVKEVKATEDRQLELGAHGCDPKVGGLA
ncbi:MAG TPA: 4Fe-4S dicluster domain-containing protein [Clostridia bacterium]|nr:4Fe-4S dicluster domain-containing protein [Clostridia bacterium]